MGWNIAIGHDGTRTLGLMQCSRLYITQLRPRRQKLITQLDCIFVMLWTPEYAELLDRICYMQLKIGRLQGRSACSSARLVITIQK